MKTTAIILTFLAQLLLPPSCAQQNNHMFKMPLKEPMSSGTEYPPISFENLVLTPHYFLIHPEPDYSRQYGCDSIMKVQMMFNATIDDTEYPVYLQHYAISDDQRLNIYPIALHEYLIGMEVTGATDRPQATLTIEKNDFGKDFFLKEGQKAIIDGLTVQVDRATHEHASFGPNQPFVAIGVCDITLSDESGQKSFSFDSHEMEKKGWPATEWGKYKVWILNMYDRILKLKIEKKYF